MSEKFSEMKKTNERRPKPKSEVRILNQVGEGSETKVFQSELQYKDGERIGGFVYKRIHQSERHSEFGRLQMEDTLQKWARIKKIKHELVKNNREGFNIPGTVRSYRDEKGTGILMTDLSHGGESPVTDFKDLPLFHESQWEIREWSKIREAVLRDVDIAIENNIDLAGGPFPLDPWVLVYNSQFDKYDIYLVDIGAYVSIYHPSEMSAQILQRGKDNIIKALDKLEKEILRNE